MKRIQIPILCLFSVLFLSACVKKTSGSVTLSVDHAHKRALALFELSAENGAIFIDSLRPDKKGNCRFSFPDDSLRFYMLVVEKDILCLLSTPGEHLHLHLDYDSLLASVALTPPLPDSLCPNAVLIRYQKTVRAAERLISQITDLWLENRYKTVHADSLHTICTNKIDSISKTVKQEAMQLLRTHTDNLVPVFIINKTLGNQSLFNFSNPQDFHFLLACAMEMEKFNPQNPHVQRLKYNLSRIENIRKQEEIRKMGESGKHVTN